jgi:hypothetical protein
LHAILLTLEVIQVDFFGVRHQHPADVEVGRSSLLSRGNWGA